MENTMDKKIAIYSDGCMDQNRNTIITNALHNVSVLSNVTIEQKYLEVGYTQMEADSMHSTIECCMRHKVINAPAKYISVCKSARKKTKDIRRACSRRQ